MLKILHTSDWHIGRSLFGRKRYDEFDAFLAWLAQLIVTENIDILLVAGDLFDTTTPSNRAQELYYRFLCKVSTSSGCHIVITSGNHDSPSFLNAPKALLESLNIHIIGTLPSNPEDEVICLKSKSDTPLAIICAVPYLRDRDIRKVKPDESMTDKTQNLILGIESHYAQISEIAKEKAETLKHIPIIGMGHLFASGGKTIEGDGVRELYVGTLAHVGKDVFPDTLDYVALGHLHLAQVVGKKETIRYSGSPIPMGFGEAGQEKKVVIISFDKKTPSIVEQPIPTFQELKKISGNLDEILTIIETLKKEKSNAWIEVEYTGQEIVGNLRQEIESAIEETEIEIRRIKNKRLVEKVVQVKEDQTLDRLDASDVFQKLLDTYEVPQNDQQDLKQSYREIRTELLEKDINAE